MINLLFTSNNRLPDVIPLPLKVSKESYYAGFNTFGLFSKDYPSSKKNSGANKKMLARVPKPKPKGKAETSIH
jgi:hypothetical protein